MQVEAALGPSQPPFIRGSAPADQPVRLHDNTAASSLISDLRTVPIVDLQLDGVSETEPVHLNKVKDGVGDLKLWSSHFLLTFDL